MKVYNCNFTTYIGLLLSGIVVERISVFIKHFLLIMTLLELPIYICETPWLRERAKGSQN